MSRPVSASDRRRDFMAFGLLLAGAALMLHAHFGMRDLAASRVTLREGEYYMNRYNTYSSRSTVGGGLVVAGVLVGLWALIRHRIGRDETAPVSAPSADINAEENRP